MLHFIPLWSEPCVSVAVTLMHHHLPLEITFTALWNHVVKEAHCFYNLFFGVTRADNTIAWNEIGGHGDQRLPRPVTEPVHGAARYQARKFQRAGTELLTNLATEMSKSIIHFKKLYIKKHRDYKSGRETFLYSEPIAWHNKLF